MSYSCLEELQVDLDLHTLNKTDVLSKISYKCNKGWFVITDDGYCHLFDKDGNLDDIKKITLLKEEYIRKDIIKKIVIPNSVTSICDLAFAWCRSLRSVMIPNSVTSIGYAAFTGCRGLTNVTIGNRVTRIGNLAFEGCTNLTSVTIGNGVTSIRNSVFYNCNKLTNLTFKGKTLKQVKMIDSYPWGIEDESIIRVE